MKITLNVFRAGMAASVCLSLLTACADGRGMGGFKSARSTPEQRAEWLAKNGGGTPTPEDGQTPAPADDSKRDDGTIDPNTLADGVTPGTENGEKAATETAPADNTGVDNGTTVAPDQELVREFPNEEAKTQVLTELGQPVSEDPAQQRVVNQAELIVANDAALNGEDAVAKGLIKGISLYVEGERDQRVLSLDAVVTIGTENRSLHVMQAPLKVTSDGQTINLPVTLKSMDTTEVAAGDSVYVIGNCKDTTCNDIQVRVEFTTGQMPKPAAVFLIQLTGDGYKVTHTNIGSPQAFDAAFAALGGKAAETTTTGDATTTTDDKAATGDTTATTTTEDAKTTETAPDATAAAPKEDIGGVVDTVTGANDVEVPKTDGPGVGVLADPATTVLPMDPRAEAIAEFRAAKAPVVVAKPAITRPPVSADAARLAAQRRAEAQRKAGAYRGATVKKVDPVAQQRAEQLEQRRRRTTAQ